MAVNASFRFHPVGQGLFYSGILTSRSRRFRGTFSLVYDCGTESPRRFLEREIDDFKALLPHVRTGKARRLDLLVISHMHDDRVNGLEYLLDGMEVNTVVMPYVDQVIRLLARADSSAEYQFLQMFYADPVDWLSSKGVHRIMLVGSSERRPRDEGRQYVEDEGDAITVNRNCILSTGRARNADLLYLKRDAPMSSNPFQWRSRFSNLELPEGEAYIHALEEFQLEQMTSLDEIFRSRTMTSKLASTLRRVIPEGKTVNRTSLVVTHEPILHAGESSRFWTSCSPLLSFRSSLPDCCADWPSWANKVSRSCRRTILTGDVVVRDLDERAAFDYRIKVWS